MAHDRLAGGLSYVRPNSLKGHMCGERGLGFASPFDGKWTLDNGRSIRMAEGLVRDAETMEVLAEITQCLASRLWIRYDEGLVSDAVLAFDKLIWDDADVWTRDDSEESVEEDDANIAPRPSWLPRLPLQASKETVFPTEIGHVFGGVASYDEPLAQSSTSTFRPSRAAAQIQPGKEATTGRRDVCNQPSWLTKALERRQRISSAEFSATAQRQSQDSRSRKTPDPFTLPHHDDPRRTSLPRTASTATPQQPTAIQPAVAAIPATASSSGKSRSSWQVQAASSHNAVSSAPAHDYPLPVFAPSPNKHSQLQSFKGFDVDPKVPVVHRVDLVDGSFLALEHRMALARTHCEYLGYSAFVLRPSEIVFYASEIGNLDKQRRSGHTLVYFERHPRPTGRLMVVPMGHYCATAAFLRQVGWRQTAFPLDWSRHTMAVWEHALTDNFETLLCQRTGHEEVHPYDCMFEDVHVFLHQGGWANEAVKRRVSRLRNILDRRAAVGLSIYFQGAANVGASMSRIVADACRVVKLSEGFVHIILVWFSEQLSSGGTPSATWSSPCDRISVLLFHPCSKANYWDGISPRDSIHLARLLEDSFPEAFPKLGGADGNPTQRKPNDEAVKLLETAGTPSVETTSWADCGSLGEDENGLELLSSEGEDSWTDSVDWAVG